jgi:nucleotide-binding universal stress UspA family protein
VYENVMVAVDNSDCSNRAVALGARLAQATSGKVTGVHVYAARLHYDRFRHLEPGLPEQYQAEEKLAYQREIHDDLIGRGLQIISDSYLDVFERACQCAGVSCARKLLEGRNYERLANDARESRYDLVVLGAHGLGRTPRSVIGSVCERVLRAVDCDVLVARDKPASDSGRLVVAMDGSSHSEAALDVALDLARRFGAEVSAVAAYDPGFHRVAFKSLAGVLSEEAARLFRFREQEALHDEIIDEGLMKVYGAHLDRARARAAALGSELGTQVVEGKASEAIAAHVEQVRASLLVVGRFGLHRGPISALGSTAENLVRLAGCDVLVVNREPREAKGRAAADAPASPAVRWSPEAEQRLDRVPRFVRGMARRRVEAFAREHGHAEITHDVFEKARGHFGM